jgi:hypothetical protein
VEEGTVVPLPKPGATLAGDPLLAVLREGARWMLMQAIEAGFRKLRSALPVRRLAPRLARGARQLRGWIAEARAVGNERGRRGLAGLYYPDRAAEARGPR